jgi:PKD repeat protein
MEKYRLFRNKLEAAPAHVAGVKRWVVLFFMLLMISSTQAMAATVYKQINFQWEYDTNLPELAGYILYQNGRYLHTIHDPAALSVDLSVGLTPGKTTIFTMKAFDENGNESAMSAPYRLEVPAAVENNNFLPKPLLSMSAMSGDAPLAIEFTADGSTDFDGVITSYFWEFGDGSSAMGAEVSYMYRTAGSFPVKLTVTDDDGSQVVSEKVVTIMPGAKTMTTPVAEFNVFPQNPSLLQAVWFSGLPSSVPNGTISRYFWDFGDGKNATGAITFHRYWLPGTYRITLTVWDEQGASSQKSFSLTVS